MTAIKDTGITRTLTVDGSEDGNTTDGTGTMVVKVYSYSGLSLEGITVGEEVVVSGSLQKEAGASAGWGLFVRPVEQVGIQRCSEHRPVPCMSTWTGSETIMCSGRIGILLFLMR